MVPPREALDELDWIPDTDREDEPHRCPSAKLAAGHVCGAVVKRAKLANFPEK